MFDIDMVQINSIVLFSFLSAALAAPAYKSFYGENDIDISIDPCFYFDGACHSCPSSEFWDGQCHKFLGADITFPGTEKHANGLGNCVKRHDHQGHLERGINQHGNNRPHRNVQDLEDRNSVNDHNDGMSKIGGSGGDWNNSGTHARHDGYINRNAKCRHEGIEAGLDFDQLLGFTEDFDALNPCRNLIDVNL
ncbi:hypothetical protein DSO57_1029763 [Entomophthora muscae]|uniref:Uncharacterized protein n=1 Tax=Entomophthora muscae TaxID=34485 RepID=A0ACC2RFQ6_9FUNG|nr:hypothetical protein DSO57_1029763 [Entomophthora muscae]